jgi:peptide/nickel transport system substrate-binding protein
VRRILTSAAACTVAALTVAACSGHSSSSGASGAGSSTGASGGQQYASGKTLTMVLPADPGSLDPQLTALSVTEQVDYFLYDSLVNIQPDGSVVSGLATTWSGTTTTASYTLKKGVTCSDGSPLTASTVAANINFIGNPKNASSRAGIWVPPGATATADDATGVVTVKSPAPDAFLVTDVGSTQVVCGNGLKDRGILKEGADGTGLYTLTSAVPGSSYTLTLRKGYAWGPAGLASTTNGLPAQVDLKVVTDSTTAANLVLTGQANVAQVIGPDAARLKAQNLAEQDVNAPIGILWFSQKPGTPTADLAVRTALTQALQLQQLQQVITSGTGTTPTGLVPAAFTLCKSNTVAGNLPSYSLTSAKAALEAAGWKAGANGVRAKNGVKLSVPLYYPTSLGSGGQAAAEFTQKAWQQLGAQVTLKGITDPQISSDIVAGQAAWSAAFIPLGLTSPGQLVPFVSGPTPPKGTDFSYINNAAYTADVAKASTTAGAAGCPSWSAAESALYKDADLVPFADSSVPTFAKGATFQMSQGNVYASSVRMLG